MTSLSTVSAGVKPATALVSGRFGYTSSQWSNLNYLAAANRYVYTGGSGVQTALNVTGSGIVSFLMFGTDSASTSANMTITLDGVEILNDDRTSVQYEGIAGLGGIYSTGASLTVQTEPTPFNSSLVVTVECNVNAWMSYLYYST